MVQPEVLSPEAGGQVRVEEGGGEVRVEGGGEGTWREFEIQVLFPSQTQERKRRKDVRS